MATAYSKRDVNRFSKTYRYVRQAPRFEYQVPESIVGDGLPGDDASPSSVETDVLSFEGGSVVTYTFAKKYSAIPHVFVSPGSESMNLSVESVSLTSAVIRSSTDNQGFAHVHVISSIGGDGVSASTISFSKKVDLTRFSKIYAYLRKRSVESYRIPSDEINDVYVEPPETERATRSFAGASSLTYTFTRTYGSDPADIPLVIVTPDDGINVYIHSISNTDVEIRASTETNASVVIQVLPATI